MDSENFETVNPFYNTANIGQITAVIQIPAIVHIT